MWECPRCHRQFSKPNQSHYCSKPESIDEYIASQPESVQPLLEQVRVTIQAAAPDASERIAWSMPAFWQKTILIQFAAGKKHIGIYPGELSKLPFTDRISVYETTKGAIRLPIDKPLDLDLIADITRFKLSLLVEPEEKAE